jgi:hypothetical protein
MEHKDLMESPTIGAAIKDKVATAVHKVAEKVHKIVGNKPPTEGQVSFISNNSELITSF